MYFILKSTGSAAMGILGGWLGGFIGFGTSLFLSIVLSVVGWYLTKYLCDEYLV